MTVPTSTNQQGGEGIRAETEIDSHGKGDREVVSAKSRRSGSCEEDCSEAT